MFTVGRHSHREDNINLAEHYKQYGYVIIQDLLSSSEVQYSIRRYLMCGHMSVRKWRDACVMYTVYHCNVSLGGVFTG